MTDIITELINSNVKDYLKMCFNNTEKKIQKMNDRQKKDIMEAVEQLPAQNGVMVMPEFENAYTIHFLITPAENGAVHSTPHEGGFFHGVLRLNMEHPYKAPNMYLITPNGRFEASEFPINPNDRGICTTYSAFHPETWTPANNVITIMKGFVSFMIQESEGEVKGLKNPPEVKKDYAKKSLDAVYNNKIVKTYFPQMYSYISYLKNPSKKNPVEMPIVVKLIDEEAIQKAKEEEAKYEKTDDIIKNLFGSIVFEKEEVKKIINSNDDDDDFAV